MELIELFIAMCALDSILLGIFFWWLKKLTEEIKFVKVQLLKAEQRATQAVNDAYYARRNQE
jgi:hypothetical protein